MHVYDRYKKVAKFCPECGKPLQRNPTSAWEACFLHGDFVIEGQAIIWKDLVKEDKREIHSTHRTTWATDERQECLDCLDCRACSCHRMFELKNPCTAHKWNNEGEKLPEWDGEGLSVFPPPPPNEQG